MQAREIVDARCVCVVCVDVNKMSGPVDVNEVSLHRIPVCHLQACTRSFSKIGRLWMAVVCVLIRKDVCSSYFCLSPTSMHKILFKVREGVYGMRTCPAREVAMMFPRQMRERDDLCQVHVWEVADDMCIFLLTEITLTFRRETLRNTHFCASS